MLTVVGMGPAGLQWLIPAAREAIAAAEALVEPYLPEASRREGLPLIFYMFTDMKTQSTDLMFYGHNAEEIIRDAFHVEPEGNIAKLPGVVSRKKQLIPPLLAALQARQ